MATTHFIGELKVTKVVKTDTTTRGLPESKRQLGEVTHITLRSDSIDALQAKMRAHLDLIDDDGVELA